MNRACGRKPRRNITQLSALSPPPTIATSQLRSSGSWANSSRLLSQWKTREAIPGSWGKARWMPGPVRTSAPPDEWREVPSVLLDLDRPALVGLERDLR